MGMHPLPNLFDQTPHVSTTRPGIVDDEVRMLLRDPSSADTFPFESRSFHQSSGGIPFGVAEDAAGAVRLHRLRRMLLSEDLVCLGSKLQRVLAWLQAQSDLTDHPLSDLRSTVAEP